MVVAEWPKPQTPKNIKIENSKSKAYCGGRGGKGGFTRKASAQRQHFGKSCRESCMRYADNSSARVQAVISLESRTVPWQNLKPSLLDDLLDHIFRHQHLPSVSLKHHLPLPIKEKKNKILSLLLWHFETPKNEENI